MAGEGVSERSALCFAAFWASPFSQKAQRRHRIAGLGAATTGRREERISPRLSAGPGLSDSLLPPWSKETGWQQDVF